MARQARLKYVPKLEFVEDIALETGMRVESLLDEVIEHPPDDHGEPNDADE